MKGSLLVAGTSSGAGKTTVVAGLCRWLARRGVAVAPFKAQNMSLNSFVTLREEEIGRAQALQAQAAGIEPEALMNPVLLKPGTETRSQVIVLGHTAADMEARTLWAHKHELLDVVVESYRELRSRFDVVVCEGAGSPAEINLRDSDIVNMGFARSVGVRSVVVGDIDRGGVFASLVGTLALLDPEDQRLVGGFIVNRFRGDVELLRPGLDMLEELTGRRTFGVLPYVDGLALDAEDSLDLLDSGDPGPVLGSDVLTVGVIRLPRASNLTDMDPIAAEPGVALRFAVRPEELADADVVIVPGSRATVDDLGWLRSRGFDDMLIRRAKEDRAVLGICGGYQMLGSRIDDVVESGAGTVDGLGLLPVRTTFEADKVLARPTRTLPDGLTVHGYEIHHGRTLPVAPNTAAFFGDEGCRAGAVAGTTWHGLFENDAFRRRYLAEVARNAGRHYVPSSSTSFAAIREARLETLADLIDEHTDTDALMNLIEGAGPGRGTLRLSRTEDDRAAR